ncbi:hypothetical protein J5N97_019496 [Dioscorea zingiberensis]|uniref:Core-2/I-branching beta-1,6-N-acetylglucosaminyltransferase family protein n=1 Tax=Dioscorea zingiberensis TaxID=325984 RepID=A0A9D5HCS0_9LILI|nr:hypothetical protein J5N97_019496 [Dioscorea zingiberensis]
MKSSTLYSTMPFLKPASKHGKENQRTLEMKDVVVRIGLRGAQEYCKPCMVSLLLLSLSLSGVILGSLLVHRLTKFPLMEIEFSSSPSASPPPSCNCSNVSKDAWHTMGDEELMQRASMVEHAGECRCERPEKAVEWGRASMVEAERRLLANALLDSSNQHFILLSESCIPLFNFSTAYNYITRSNLSFLSSFDDPRKAGRGRYNKLMMPAVRLQQWRKGSQWFHLRRKLAIEVVSDNKYFMIFKQHCRAPCYMDEHYIPTLVTMFFPEFNSNRSITFVDWSRGGKHPVTFKHKDVSEKLLQSIRHGSSCIYNGHSTSLCFLFARKFDPSTLGPLLKIAPTVLGFDV